MFDEYTEQLKKFLEQCSDTITSLQDLEQLREQQQMEEEKEILVLERRKKYCKNFLELKQINRELSLLKFRKNK